MTMSWKNFFFGAFDPGGFITVDKPPAFLWVGALSARIFGYSNWSILLPSSVAGAASVGLLWLIVRRYFGLTAATIAGLVLALSPISVAVNRLNMPEPFLILALIGAAGAVLRSLESRRWWAWTVLAGFLVGVAFNTKMLDGWIPGPALALALVVAVPTVSRTSARQLLARLAVLGAVTLIVSASWMLVVDAWPASDRPYIGGSTNNTVLDLALGYNGFGRVNGEDQLGGGGARPGSNTGQGQRLPDGTDGGRAQGLDGQPVQPGGQGAPPGVQAPAGQAAPGGTGLLGGFRGAGGIIGGIPSLLRMFDDANGGQIGWLLPFALGGGLIALWSWRRDPVRRAFAVLFLGWIALYGGIFSYAQGIYHSYYTSAMAPGVAALVGVGTVTVADAVRRDRRWLVVADRACRRHRVDAATDSGAHARLLRLGSPADRSDRARRGRYGRGPDSSTSPRGQRANAERGGTPVVAGGVVMERLGERLSQCDVAPGRAAAGCVRGDVWLPKLSTTARPSSRHG